jgi:flagellar protein FlgJ
MRTDPNAVTNSLDARTLDALRAQAANNPRAAAKQAAVQFESLFMSMMVKSMRDATPKAEDNAGSGGDTFTAMLDSQFANRLSGRPGGLAEMLEQQLTRHMQNLPAPSPENVQAAMPAAAAPAPAAVPSTTSLGKGTGNRAANFIRDMLPHAREAERQTGVPASFILGQAALESGWGKGEMKNADGSPSFNLFGVKATSGWKGATTNVQTTEYEGGQPVRQKAAFRSYGSYTEAFADYARMLASHPRYAGVVRGASTAEAFAGGMQRAGYATDPQYASKLARTINTTVALSRALA